MHHEAMGRTVEQNDFGEETGLEYSATMSDIIWVGGVVQKAMNYMYKLIYKLC